MKRKVFFNFVTLLTLGGMLIFAPRALAQDDPPGEDQGADRMIEPSKAYLPLKTSYDKSFDSDLSMGLDKERAITPETGILDIATSTEHEDDSDVAYGYSEYGVVYNRKGEIYIQFVRFDGVIGNKYLLSNGSGRSSSPAVAFEGTNNLYVVAWQYDFGGTGDDYDISARAVSPYGIVGDEAYVTESFNLETDPDLDCNHDDESCLVVFSYEDTPDYIKGRFLDVSTLNGVTNSVHAAFRVSTTSTGRDGEEPFIAWGQDIDRYMVAFNSPGGGGNKAVAAYTLIYDTYQGPVNQYVMTSKVLLDKPYDVKVTGVTYDPVTERFLALASYDCEGDGSDSDIYLVIIRKCGANEDLSGFPVATLPCNETMGSISFLTNAWAAKYDTGPDKVAIAYCSDLGGKSYVVTTVIKGNGSKTNPSYEIPEENDHMIVKEASSVFHSLVEKPAVAGSDGSGLYLVTLTDDVPAFSPVEDILGRIMRDSSSTDNNIFLPLFIK